MGGEDQQYMIDEEGPLSRPCHSHWTRVVGPDRVDFSLIGDKHGGGRSNASEDTESVMVAEAEWDVDGNTSISGESVD